VDLRGYLRILRRQWLVIVAGVLLGVAVASVYVIASNAKYASTARLFISTPLTDASSQAYQGSLFSQQRVQSYADLITGSTVANKVIDKLGLTEPPESLMSRVSATAEPQTVIIEITGTGPTPQDAQQVAQTTAEVFSDYVTELEGSTTGGQAPIRANIVDDAGLPLSPVSPRPLLDIGIGVIAGLMLGLGAAWVRESLDTTITTPQALAAATDSTTLGVIYFDPTAPALPLVTDVDSHAPRAEAFRVLGTNIQFLEVDRPSKIITITSPLPGDGKSTTAVNIAITMAQSGVRTVLVEADLRRPKIADYLRLEAAVGLTTVLRGQLGVDDVLQPWGSSGLCVVTSGAIPPNPAELLQSKAMATVLAELNDRFEMVVVDAPPLLPVTDAAVLASLADGAILVARHRQTTKDGAAQSMQRLRAVDATLFGTVLNFADQGKGMGGGYGYGYGYGSRTGPDEAAAPDPVEPETEPGVGNFPTTPGSNTDPDRPIPLVRIAASGDPK